MLTLKNQQKNKKRQKFLKKIKIRQIFILIGLTEISLKKFQLLLIATDLIRGIKLNEFKYIGIRDLVNNIRNNTSSKISAKKV